MASLRISGIVDDSVVDGEGYRFTIFTQGCPHGCPGCHNPQTHDNDGGYLVDTDELYQQICESPLLSGVTFSGGEPFLQPQELAELARRLQTRGLNITTYTGYTLEELQQLHCPSINELLDVTDILIDGPFLLAERDLTLAFRGSRNQRIIDMNRTRQSGTIVLKEFSD